MDRNEVFERLDDYAAYCENEIRECKSDWLKISYHRRSIALRAAAELIRAGGWRPIAEAPRDGTPIEAGEPDSGWVRVVQYASEQSAWYLLGSADSYYAFDFFKVFRPVPTVPAPPQEGE